jgi:hypothetical protein
MDLYKIKLLIPVILLQPYMRIQNACYRVFTKVINVCYYNIKTGLNVKGFMAEKIYFYPQTALYQHTLKVLQKSPAGF